MNSGTRRSSPENRYALFLTGVDGARGVGVVGMRVFSESDLSSGSLFDILNIFDDEKYEAD